MQGFRVSVTRCMPDSRGAHNALNFFEEARKMLKSQEQMMIGRIRVAEM